MKGVLFKHFAYDLGVRCLVLLNENSSQIEADANGQNSFQRSVWDKRQLQMIKPISLHMIFNLLGQSKENH